MQTQIAAEMKLPQLVTELPGPKAKKIVERDHAVLSPSYTRDYPLVAKTGRGAMVEDVDGNTFLDFAAGIAVVATGHCHPRSRRRDPEAGRRTDSHVLHGFLLPGHGRTRRKTRVDRARQGRQARLFRQFRHRSHRSGDEARPLSHAARQIHRVLRLLPRPHDGLAFADGEQSRAAQAIRRAARRRLSRALSEHLSRRRRRSPGKRRRRCARVHRRGAFQAPRRSRGSRRNFHRADSGRRRLSSRAGRISAGARAHLPQARHPARRRRSAVRHGPHRQVVGRGSRRHRAGHDLHGERHRFRHAAQRRDRQSRRHELEARRARLDLRRQSRRDRRVARHHRPARRWPHRQCRAHGRIHLSAAWPIGASGTKSSATFAAKA